MLDHITASRRVITDVMHSAVIASPGQIKIETVRLPEPKSRQVRVRLQGCGVCASNLEIWAGQPWFSYPLEPGAPGHEGWGVIDKIGDGVQELVVGERVAVLSGHAYAEYDTADTGSVLRIPEKLTNCDVPAEPLGCAMNIFKRSNIMAGQNVAIVGVGFLGILLTQLATEAGANVIAIGRRKFALDLAAEYGAKHLIEMTDQTNVVQQVMALTRDRGCEVVIEAAGKQGPLTLAAELTSERGRLVIAGYHQDGSREIDMQLWNWRGLDVINAHERDPRVYLEGMRSAFDAITDGRLDPAPLYTHTFSLDEVGKALDMTRDRPDGFMKAIIKL